jgi:hypothetical protein
MMTLCMRNNDIVHVHAHVHQRTLVLMHTHAGTAIRREQRPDGQYVYDDVTYEESRDQTANVFRGWV